jgi:hypothetical protein
MSTTTRTPGSHRRLALLLAPLALALALLVPAGAAHADYYLSDGQANAMAADFVASHYANTYTEDLTTTCRGQGHRFSAPAGYGFHRQVCRWFDSSDQTSGRVLIIGSRGSGNYYGVVLNGAR